MQQPARSSRRKFLKDCSLAALAGATLPYVGASSEALAFFAAGERPVFGSIGVGGRGSGIMRNATQFGEVAAVCDVDAAHVGRAREAVGKIQSERGLNRTVDTFDDYRKLLDRKDIDAVTIGTPDHWHAKIAVEAMQAGKDVYCEKPLTLTIEEGNQIIRALEKTKRVFQVGTQQRSEYLDKQKDNVPMFLTAVALVRAGRLGKIQRVTCGINGAPTSAPIPVATVPAGFNWERWQGQTPLVEYRRGEPTGEKGPVPTRAHFEFRWWYEYSGGKMTDWGAHHVDIAQWAIGMEQSGPLAIEGTAQHPCPMKGGYPTLDDRYNVASSFNVSCRFANGVEMIISSEGDNGILFEGTEGRLFVNRGKLTGKPVDDLASKPLPADALASLYKGKTPGNHMRNFVECIKDRSQPISDVHTHHRVLTTCHLANIAIRLGRKLEWNPEKQQIVGDAEAQSFQAREARKGYEIVV